jgi:peptidoglycan/xylan/chitin deacetylase (PgdA/CDA1 family)
MPPYPPTQIPVRVGGTRRIFSLFKRLIFLLYLYSGYVQLRDLILSLLGRARAVVVYYHRVGGSDVMSRPSDEFRRDIAFIRENYECVSLAELCERLHARVPLRRRVVVVTFDDGYRDNYTQACPILLEARVHATFFVATGFVSTEKDFPHDSLASRPDEPTPDNPQDFPKITWDDLRQMETWGFEIGSHTVNHTNIGLADETTAACEIDESLDALNRELGARPRAFSFPWGKPADIPRAAIEIVKRAGYYASVSAFGGVNRRGSNHFEIRRVDVGNGNLSRLGLRARVAGFDPDYWFMKLGRNAAGAPSQVNPSQVNPKPAPLLGRRATETSAAFVE